MANQITQDTENTLQGIGLTEKQAEEYRQQGLANIRPDSSTRSKKSIICKNVFTYFNFIFLTITILLILVRSYRDLTFLPIIFSNTAIGILQELRSKKILDKLTLLNDPQVIVIREGEKKRILAEELVKEDVVELAAGNQVPADARVLQGEVFVNEALLTGEAKELQKKEGEELLSGSYIVSGKCLAKLEKVGKEAYISKLTVQATKGKNGEQSEMIRSLNRLVRIIGVLILPIGTLLFVQQYYGEGAGLKESVTGMVAAILGMIPEGLYLLASVAMVVSAMRLAKQQVLLHDMKCIEALARVDVLCVDKTGTITEAAMEVEKVEILEGEEQEILELLADFGENMPTDNETMKAVQKYFRSVTGRKTEKRIPFSSERKYSAMQLEGKNYVLGAPERLVSKDEHKEKIMEYQKDGYRVLVFGRYEGDLEEKELKGNLIPEAFLLFSNPIRKGAVETFSYFRKRGVALKVISGDHPCTVSRIAELAGIERAEQYIDATELVDEKKIEEAVSRYTVFGRVTPEQKRLLVQALKKQGKTVAMTGDGVNDVLALKEADCSVAMASGSEAAAQVSQLVLMDSDFSRMPEVVMEGRRVVNNIEKTASMYLVKNIFSMLLAVFSVLLHMDYPLEPSQISLISTFTIGPPSFFLALEQNTKRMEGHFLKKVFLRALPAGLTDFLAVSGLVYFAREFDIAPDCVSTVCTVLITIVGFWMLIQVAKPFRPRHGILLAGMMAGWLFCATVISPLFAMQPLSKRCILLVILFTLAVEPFLHYLKMGVEQYLSKK
ncbi:MAG: cation-translocating P-type ATPase [Roseburia sp.]